MRLRRLLSYTLKSAKQAVCTAPENLGARLQVAQATTAWALRDVATFAKLRPRSQIVWHRTAALQEVAVPGCDVPVR